MNGIWLAAGAALGWGGADYFGGTSRRQTSVFLVVAVSEFLGFLLLIPVLVVHGQVAANPRLLLAAVAGAGVTIELCVIYVALSRGEGFVTAPVGALGAAIAAGAGFLRGDPLNAKVAIGLACALIGGAVSASTSGRSRTGNRVRSAALCAGAGAGAATMLISLNAAGHVDPYWATAIEHTSTALCALVIDIVVNGRFIRPRLPQVAQMRGLSLVAIVGLGGDLAYASASRHGSLSVVAAISSLYPLTTVVLSIAVQRQRPHHIQLVGVVLALAGAALLGASTT